MRYIFLYLKKIMSNYRQMKIILIYDLPTVETEDIKSYNKFHKDIKRIGFFMLQYSVYAKVLTNHSDYQNTLVRVKKVVPKKGSIIILRLTEKQYEDMIYLSGEKNFYDTIVGGNEVIIFGGDKDD